VSFRDRTFLAVESKTGSGFHIISLEEESYDEIDSAHHQCRGKVAFNPEPDHAPQSGLGAEE
jgi:hypothetical protein